MWTSTLLWAATGLTLVAGAPLHEKRNIILFKSLAAMTQFNFLDFELTKVGLTCDRSNSSLPYACGLKFDWHDPNSVRQNNVTSASCLQTFEWDGVHHIGSEDGFLGSGPSETCFQGDGTFFTSTLLYFKSPSNFTLQLAHTYRDSENFTSPWDHPTTFAQPTISLPVLERSETQIKLFKEGLINATVVGVSI